MPWPEFSLAPFVRRIFYGPARSNHRASAAPSDTCIVRQLSMSDTLIPDRRKRFFCGGSQAKGFILES